MKGSIAESGIEYVHTQYRVGTFIRLGRTFESAPLVIYIVYRQRWVDSFRRSVWLNDEILTEQNW